MAEHRGVVVDGSRRRSVAVGGVIVPVLVLAGLAAFDLLVGPPAVAIALMVAVPLLSAVFAGPMVTALVGVLTIATAAALALLPGDVPLDSVTVPLIAVAVASIVAVVASLVRRPPEAEEPEAVEHKAGPSLAVPSLADTDEMTGLLNRRGAIRALGPRNAENARVVGFLDCDLFKRVNEDYGTDVGDEFLQAIAGRLRHSLPAHDTVARWDGDEFLVAMTTDATSARPAFERVVTSINSHPIRTTAGAIPASISVGAAVWGSGQELEEVIARAGRALYAAKSGGRGLVVVDDGPAEDDLPAE